jgi:hypothetical protein
MADAASGQDPSSASAETETSALLRRTRPQRLSGPFERGGLVRSRRQAGSRAQGARKETGGNLRHRAHPGQNPSAHPVRCCLAASCGHDQTAATRAEDKPARRRRNADRDTARKLDNKQDRTSASRETPDEPASPPPQSQGRRQTGRHRFPKALTRDEAATPAATPQAAPMPASAAFPLAGSFARLFPAQGMGTGVMPGLGLLSSVSGAPTVASLSEAHALLDEAAEICRIGMDANMRAAQSLAGAHAARLSYSHDRDSMRILAGCLDAPGLPDLRAMRASS